MKKIIFVISFIVLSGFIFGFSASEAKAQTVAELQAQIQQLMAQIAELQAKLSQLRPEPLTWCHNFNVNLRVGDRGLEVTALQTALQKEGLYQRVISGNFDEYTASIVVAFQEKYASEVLAPWRLTRGTGYVGPSTRAKLNKLYGCQLSCQTLWWHDNNHQYCQQKKFCGAYMYPGLSTFQTKEECEVNLKKPSITSITVTSPNGGEQWTIGKAYDIKWKSAGISLTNNEVGILLYKGGSLEKVIISPTLNDGVYSWAIPVDVKPGSDYKIRVSATEKGILVEDFSDNYFNIIASPIVVLCDNYGDVNQDGKLDETDVSWISQHIAGTRTFTQEQRLRADLNQDGQINVLDLTMLKQYLDGNIAIIPACHKSPPCGNYGDVNNNNWVNLRDADLMSKYIAGTITLTDAQKKNADVNGDGNINVLDLTLVVQYVTGEINTFPVCKIIQPSITVISPNGGEKWEIGKTYPITWSSAGVDKVNISYYRKGGPISLCDGCCDYNLIAENVSAYLGKYSWTVPSNFSAGEYKILIRDSSLSPAVPPCVNDFSDNYFSIVISKEGPCGDVTGDGYVYLNDVTLLQNYVGYPDKYPISNKWVADVNCDGVIDMGDVILLKNYISYPGSYVLRCCGGTCGDVNKDGAINVGDSTLCYNHVKSPIVYPLPNPWAADVNCDKKIDNNDCNLILNYVGYPGQYKFNCCP